MDLKHFGDSYDVVKKSLLQWLSTFGLWAAHPMFTHPTSADQAEEFSRFLGVPLVSAEVLTGMRDRSEYFKSCHQYHNLFLDPDTGIRLKNIGPRRSTGFIFAKEMIDLVRVRPQALTMAFDQSLARGREREQIRSKLVHFADQGVHGFAYASHASFVVLGQSKLLIQQAHAKLLASSALPTNRIVTTSAAN